MPFTLPGIGYKSKLLIAHELSYATAPAAAEYALELVTASITPRLSVIEDPSMSATQVSRRFIGQGGQYVEASFRVRVGFEGLLPILRMFFPTYVATNVESGVNDHSFKEGVDALSWCADFVWGDIPSGKATRLLGGYGTRLRIAGVAGTGEGAMLMADIDMVAKSATPNTTPMSSVALPPALGVIFHEALRTSGDMDDGSGLAEDSIPITGFDFSVQHPYDTQRFLFGQVNAEQPIRNGFTDATLSFDEEWSDPSLMDAARANTPSVPLILTFQHPTTIGAASKRELEISASNPTAAEYGTEVPGFGKVTQRVAWRLAYDTGDASLVSFRVRSTEADMGY